MSIQQYFQAHPNLSSQLEAGRESFSKQATKGSFTAFVLQQKIVAEEDYLVWAQIHYSLPLLKNDFFYNHQPDMDLWARSKKTYAWNAECLPVGEWDGVLFVGCLEKPSDFNLMSPVCFTLSSPVSLENWHQQYESKPSDILALELQDDEVLVEEGSSIPLENKTLGNLVENSFIAELNAFKPQLTRLDPTSIPVAQNIPIDEVIPNMTTPEKKTNLKVLPQTQTKAQPKSSTPIKVQPPGDFYLARLSSTHNDLENELKKICTPLTANFEKFMILSVNETETEARPLTWSEGFNPCGPEYSISLKNPSLFYIVTATYKPFHGPISLNEANEKFFDDWNMSYTPGHATAIPIINKDHLLGILLALGEPSAYNNQVLRSTVKIVNEIGLSIHSKLLKSAA